MPARIDALFASSFLQRLVRLIVAWSAISHLIGRAGGVASDEHDPWPRQCADRAGKRWPTLIVVACIVVLVSVPAQQLSWWLATIVLANLALGLLIAKSFAEHLVLTYAYRAGRA